MRKERNSGIEILRIVSLLGVIMIHYCDRALPAMAGGDYYALDFLRSLCSSSVDVFVIITGYFLCKSNQRTLFKPVFCLLQVVIISEMVYLCNSMAIGLPIKLSTVIGYLIPNSYFITFYVVLYIISPFLNIMWNAITSLNGKRNAIISFYAIFSIWSIISLLLQEVSGSKIMGISPVGAWGSQQGFNIVNFVLLYLIGAYLRDTAIPCIVNLRSKILYIIITILLIWGWSIFSMNTSHFGMRSAWCYDNPLVILLGAQLFNLFESIKIKSGIINALSAAVLPAYLIHSRLMSFVAIEKFAEQGIFVLLIHYIVFSVVIIIVSFIFNEIYSFLFLNGFGKLKKYYLFSNLV